MEFSVEINKIEIKCQLKFTARCQKLFVKGISNLRVLEIFKIAFSMCSREYEYYFSNPYYTTLFIDIFGIWQSSTCNVYLKWVRNRQEENENYTRNITKIKRYAEQSSHTNISVERRICIFVTQNR